MARVVKISVLIFLWCVVGLGAARAENTLTFEPEVVTVSGLHLGNFVMLGSGQMLKASILHLDQPVTVTGNPQSAGSKRTVSNVEMILLEPEPGVELEDLMGKRLKLEGRLFHSPSEPHHTEVVMKVSKVLEVSDQ